MTEMIVLPPLRAQHGAAGGYVLTRKYGAFSLIVTRLRLAELSLTHSQLRL
jgi:hypothetical protein